MSALEISLRQEVTRHDALAIKEWMEDHEVTKYLNELSNISQEIQHAINRVNMYIMTHLFNQGGSFFVVCAKQGEPIGFIKLIRKCSEAEIVVVIGDKEKWGHGYGTRAIYQGLNQAFFEWRTPKVIAKIDPRNIRSIKAFKKTGFRYEKALAHTHQFHITLEDYIKHINN